MKMLLPISRTLGMSIESLVKRCARLDDVFLAGRNKLRRKENIGAVFGCTASLVVTPWDSRNQTQLLCSILLMKKEKKQTALQKLLTYPTDL